MAKRFLTIIKVFQGKKNESGKERRGQTKPRASAALL
jgi:hypothetical protein